MDRLSVEQILFLHDRLIRETGGSHGVRDVGLLESAAARPFATFGGEDLHPGLLQKAAALFDGLIRNHPFVDGNKRIAIAAASLFLIRNGRRMVADNDQLERFTLQAATTHMMVDEIEAWFESKSAETGGLNR